MGQNPKKGHSRNLNRFQQYLNRNFQKRGIPEKDFNRFQQISTGIFRKGAFQKKISTDFSQISTAFKVEKRGIPEIGAFQILECPVRLPKANSNLGAQVRWGHSKLENRGIPN